MRYPGDVKKDKDILQRILWFQTLIQVALCWSFWESQSRMYALLEYTNMTMMDSHRGLQEIIFCQLKSQTCWLSMINACDAWETNAKSVKSEVWLKWVVKTKQWIPKVGFFFSLFWIIASIVTFDYSIQELLKWKKTSQTVWLNTSLSPNSDKRKSDSFSFCYEKEIIVFTNLNKV